MLGSMTVTGPPEIRAPRGSERSCKGWPQEAALRMLMNNLDPDVAERPADLVVYGGTGKAARNWDAFHRIVRALRRLEGDETLLIQSGKPVGVFRTQPSAPRVLISNAVPGPGDGFGGRGCRLGREGRGLRGGGVDRPPRKRGRRVPGAASPRLPGRCGDRPDQRPRSPGGLRSGGSVDARGGGAAPGA